MTFLVWNRVKIWRTERHTHQELPAVPPGRSGNWAEDQRSYSGSGLGLPYKSDKDPRQEIKINALRETNVGVAQT